MKMNLSKIFHAAGFGATQESFCAFCRQPRIVFRKKRVNLYNLLACMLGTAIFSAAYWQEFDPRSILIFIFLMALSEIFLQIRWRMTVVCRHCGFDPVLYVRNTEQAAANVKIHLDRRASDPRYILARPLKLPRLTRERAEVLQKMRQEAEKTPKIKKGHILSKQI